VHPAALPENDKQTGTPKKYILMIYFNLKYFAWAVLLLVVEIFIGLKMHDAIIRPYGGDFLVVILICCFVKAFLNLPVKPTALGALLFAYEIEISHYFHLIKVFGLERSTAARLILGTSFSWTDMLMYTLGIILVLIIEHLFAKWQHANR
jgi:hypothetical protein